MLARRWLINVALLAVLAVLLLAVLLDRREEQRSTRLTTLEPNAIMDIELYRAGEPPVRLRREEERWQMQAPFAVAADGAAVAKVLPVAGAEVSRTLPASGLDLGELGLDPAPVRVLLDGLELRFGGTEPVAAQRYVQVGDMVHLIDDRYLPRLMTPTTELVSRRLLPPDFSPGLGDLDGTPLTAGALAPLAEAEAVRVEMAANQLDDVLDGRVLRINSADGGDAIEFLVSDGGNRWTRLDAALSWLFATPPLDAVREWQARGGPPAPTADMPFPDAPPLPPITLPPDSATGGATPAALPNAAPEPAGAPLPVERLAPPPPGAEPVERRPTDAIPNLRDLAPRQLPNRTALPQNGVDPFAPPPGAAEHEWTPTDASGSNAPLPTEKLRP